MSAKTQRLQAELKQLKRETEVSLMGMRAELARYKQEAKNGIENTHYYREKWQNTEEKLASFSHRSYDRNTVLLTKLGNARRRRKKIQFVARVLADELFVLKAEHEELQEEYELGEILLGHALSSIEEEDE